MDAAAVGERVVEQLVVDFACERTQLTSGGVSFAESRKLAGRRPFPWRDRRLTLVTTGSGVVVCADAETLLWARARLGTLTRDEVLTPQTLSLLQSYVGGHDQFMDGPVLKFVCSSERLRAPAATSGLELTSYADDEIAVLYGVPDVPNALRRRNPDRPDRVASAAWVDGRVVGLAAASEDCEHLWQIGIEVVDGYRRRGLARELVGAVTAHVLELGRVPYYSTYVGNLGSIRTALGLGYWTAWIELDSRDRS